MKTVVRLPNWIGDAVMATPTIRLLIEQTPDNQVAVWGPPKSAAIFHGFPGVATVFELDEKKEPERLVEIRESGFSNVYLLTNSYSTAKSAQELGIPNRIGYRRDWRGKFLTHPVSCGPRIRAMHMIDYYLHLLPADWRTPPVDRLPQLHLREGEIEAIRERVAGLCGAGEREWIGISPGAAFGSAKKWDPTRFHQVARAMAGEGYRVVVCGTQSERAVADFILEGIPPEDGCNLAGVTSLRELMAALSVCRAVVTNDSGPMHLCDGLGTPTVALFGSTDSTWTGPTHPHHVVLQSQVVCSPCFLRECPLDRECMESLTVEAVINGVRRILDAKAASSNLTDREG